MRRGEIWTAAGGPDYAGKPRPVVIVQDDNFAETASVTICGFTTDPTEAALVRPLVLPSPDNGLTAPSRLMADKIMTVPRTKLGRQTGVLAAADTTGLNRAIALILGLAGAA